MSPAQRNAEARRYVLHMLDQAAKSPLAPNLLETYKTADETLTDVIRTEAKGFRGLVLTAIVGVHLDPNYDPSRNFYDCNPRSIFEQGIYSALAERDIPCGKSDPLNVAKNAQQLDEAWAKGRRPESAAMGVVSFIRLLSANKGTEQYADLVRLFFARLLEYAKFVQDQNYPISLPATTFLSTSLAHKLTDFALECAEGGALPQFIVGLLVSKLRKDDARYKGVKGWEESVFGTNTTGKKPADIWEIRADGSFGKLYEVTVKIIDKKRLDDYIDGAASVGTIGCEVIFICDFVSNTRSLVLEDGSLIHKGVQFQFLDIRSFISVVFAMLSQDDQNELVVTLQDFIFQPTRAVKTKRYWAENFSTQ